MQTKHQTNHQPIFAKPQTHRGDVVATDTGSCFNLAQPHTMDDLKQNPNLPKILDADQQPLCLLGLTTIECDLHREAKFPTSSICWSRTIAVLECSICLFHNCLVAETRADGQRRLHRQLVRVVKEVDLKSIGFARGGSNPPAVVKNRFDGFQ